MFGKKDKTEEQLTELPEEIVEETLTATEPETANNSIDPVLLEQLGKVSQALGVDLNGAMASLIGIADTLINFPELGNLVMQASKMSDGTITDEEIQALQTMMQGDQNQNREQIMNLIEAFLPGAGASMQGFMDSLAEGAPEFEDDSAFIKSLQNFVGSGAAQGVNDALNGATQGVVDELNIDNPSAKNPSEETKSDGANEDDDNTRVKKSMVKISVTANDSNKKDKQNEEIPTGKKGFLEYLNSKL